MATGKGKGASKPFSGIKNTGVMEVKGANVPSNPTKGGKVKTGKDLRSK